MKKAKKPLSYRNLFLRALLLLLSFALLYGFSIEYHLTREQAVRWVERRAPVAQTEAVLSARLQSDAHSTVQLRKNSSCIECIQSRFDPLSGWTASNPGLTEIDDTIPFSLGLYGGSSEEPLLYGQITDPHTAKLTLNFCSDIDGISYSKTLSYDTADMAYQNGVYYLLLSFPPWPEGNDSFYCRLETVTLTDVYGVSRSYAIGPDDPSCFRTFF